MKRFLFGCLTVLALVGCNNNPRVVVMVDGGGGGTDTGGGGTDSGGGGTDSGGGGTDSGSACGPMTADAPTAPACAMATLTCLMGATTADAQMACYEADPNPEPCQGCVYQDVFASATRGGGCAPQYGTLQCCLADACPTGDAACLNAAGGAGGACASDAMGFLTCVQACNTARTCGITATCFGA